MQASFVQCLDQASFFSLMPVECQFIYPLRGAKTVPSPIPSTHISMPPRTRVPTSQSYTHPHTASPCLEKLHHRVLRRFITHQPHIPAPRIPSFSLSAYIHVPSTHSPPSSPSSPSPSSHSPPSHSSNAGVHHVLRHRGEGRGKHPPVR